MSAKRLNSTALPSITGLAASAPRLPRPRMAVPLVMTATMLPRDGVVVGGRRVGGDRLDRHGDAGRIGEREIALRRHRLGGDDLELARPPAGVELQRLLIGDRGALARSVGLSSHALSSGCRREAARRGAAETAATRERRLCESRSTPCHGRSAPDARPRRRLGAIRHGPPTQRAFYVSGLAPNCAVLQPWRAPWRQRDSRAAAPAFAPCIDIKICLYDYAIPRPDAAGHEYP